MQSAWCSAFSITSTGFCQQTHRHTSTVFRTNLCKILKGGCMSSRNDPKESKKGRTKSSERQTTATIVALARCLLSWETRWKLWWLNCAMFTSQRAPNRLVVRMIVVHVSLFTAAAKQNLPLLQIKSNMTSNQPSLKRITLKSTLCKKCKDLPSPPRRSSAFASSPTDTCLT